MKIDGVKMKMTQLWDKDKVIPVTIIKVINKETFSSENLEKGDIVAVSGRSKGRGFQGVVKRHGFHGGPQTHDQKNRLRAPGSIGATAPQRVIKGKKMAGHMGNRLVTIKKMKIVEVKPEEGILVVKGAIPGSTGGKIKISK